MSDDLGKIAAYMSKIQSHRSCIGEIEFVIETSWGHIRALAAAELSERYHVPLCAARWLARHLKKDRVLKLANRAASAVVYK